MNKPKKLYNVRMFADKAGISHQYIYRALKEGGTIPEPFMYTGNSPAWTESQVNHFIKERGSK